MCFFWGTTYLGIRVALEGMGPLLLVATRFTLSGGAILLWAWWRKWEFPRGAALWWPAGTGLLTLGVGNYSLALAETFIPSGLAALFITVAPFWMVGAEAVFPGGTRVNWKQLCGMLVGFSGAVWLVGPEALTNGWNGNMVKGFLILQLSCLGWSFGSILQKRRPEKTHPVMVGAIQQFSVGICALLVCTATGNWEAHWSMREAGAIVYLAAFGSIVAYSAYLHALQNLPVAVVSLYTYVNPVVAVALGWLFYGEAFGLREVSAMMIIFSGVWLTRRLSRKP